MQPFISVIVPNYNHAEFLKQRIDSILNQTYQHFEVILLDDASTDNSLEILQSYAQHPKVKCVLGNKKNSGSPFAQWYKGIAEATGEWIWIAESDDYATPFFLETLVNNIKDQTAIAYCRSIIVNEKGEEMTDTRQWLSDLSETQWDSNYTESGKVLLEKYLAYKNIISNVSSALLNKAFLLPPVPNINKFRTCGDWLLYADMATKGDVFYLADSHNYWRQHAKTTRQYHSLDSEYIRMHEITQVIKTFGKLSKKYCFTIDYAKYKWLVDWWLARFTYKNIFKRKYILAPLHRRLLLGFYARLLGRIASASCHSIKNKYDT